ncbi:MAG: 6-bladed beta-propeller [Bacteroidetes bacterium]|nr:6-bladed beta-propeller [Bacteroidota bacterium]
MPLTRFGDSPIIDSLLASAPHFVVNTDVETERWVATTRLGLPTDSLIFGRPSNLIAIGDSVYISDRQSEAIFAVGKDGYLSRKIGGPGKAPGEFTYLSGLQYNGLHVFTKDQERIQLFTDKFGYVNSFYYSGLRRQFAASPGFMLLGCPDGGWLICTRSTSPPYAWIHSGELLPVLDLPDRTGENGHIVTISPNGNRIAMAYKGFPYIFFYDDQFRHLRTIRFEGKDVRNFKSVGLPDGVPAGVVEPGTFSFIETIKFINSRYLVARVHRTDNYIFDFSENDYELARKIIFRPTNDPEERKNIPAADFLLHGDHLYVSSPWEEYVYGYEFDLE